jgi:hypothetical protein
MSYTPNNPNGQATSANSAPVTLSSEQQTILSDIKAKTDNLDVALSTRTKPADTQLVSAASLPLPTGAATESTLSDINTKTPALSGGRVPVIIGTDGQVNTAKTIFQYSASGQNTTTTQLASAAVFTGTIESIPDQSDYSILFFSDQNATITINQYIDSGGTYKIASRTYVYAASTSDFAISDVANGNYLQVIVTNTGASTTTLLNLNTAYGTIRPTEQDIDLTINGQSSQSATIANIIPTTAGTGSTDVSKYRSFSIQILSSGTGGTFIFEGSNNNIDFVAIPIYNASLVVRVPIVTAITASSSAIIYEGSCNFRYMRVRIATTITGGVIRAYSNFIKTPLGTTSQVVSNGTAANLLVTASGSLTSAGTTTNTPATPTVSNINSAATTNATSVKASAGTVYNVSWNNTNAAARYLKFYNKASAPTVGTDVPLITIAMAATSSGSMDFGPLGHRFATGIALATTTGMADSDTAAVAVNEIKIMTAYI